MGFCIQDPLGLCNLAAWIFAHLSCIIVRMCTQCTHSPRAAISGSGVETVYILPDVSLHRLEMLPN